MSCAGSAPDISDAASTSLLASVVPLVRVWRVDRAFDYSIPAELADRVIPGCVVRVTFGGRRVRGIVRTVERRAAERELNSIDGVVVAKPVAGPPLGELFDWEARRYVTTPAASWSRAVPPRVRVEAAPAPALSAGAGRDLRFGLTGESLLLDSVRAGRPGVWVVRPDPLTRRHELVAALVAAAAPGSVLVAVPELAHGSQTIDALAKHFPALVRTDSAVSETERSAALLRLTEGRGLGAGGRSVVHAPAPDLSLMVVDEEPHPSLKEDRSPRYDARRSAVERARLHTCPCVFVSSTPSVEAGFKAATGEWSSVGPSRGRERQARPVVEVAPADPSRVIGRELYERMRAALQKGRRVAVLVPQAGFARAMWCASCRRSLRCPRCESGVAVRGEDGAFRVRCLVCAFEAEAPAACPSCGASEWRYLGAGSQRHAQQLGKSFPRARVYRVDPDALEVPATPPDIYVTTWVGTKPALRPDVSVVGVLDADALIRRPDFRAAESSYQALAAMAEWAGPAEAGGRLVIQCSEPGHHAVQSVARADYSYFLERELELRKELSYPPFSELVRVWTAVGSTESLEAAAAAARRVGGSVLGPAPARRGRGRVHQILVKCPDAQIVADELRPVMAASPRALSIDVDPR